MMGTRYRWQVEVVDSGAWIVAGENFESPDSAEEFLGRWLESHPQTDPEWLIIQVQTRTTYQVWSRSA